MLLPKLARSVSNLKYQQLYGGCPANLQPMMSHWLPIHKSHLVVSQLDAPFGFGCFLSSAVPCFNFFQGLFAAGAAGTAEPAEGSISQNSSDFRSDTSSGRSRRFGDFHIFHDLADFRAVGLVLEPTPLERLEPLGSGRVAFAKQLRF